MIDKQLKEIYKFILLKIQNNEWKENQMLPSERSLSIKFQISKNVINKIFRKMVENGIIYSKPNKGYFVSQNKGFFFLSSTENNDQTSLEKSDEKLDQDDLKKIENYSKINSEFYTYEKKYFIDKKICKKVVIFINKNIKNSDKFVETNDQSWPLYKWFAQNGKAIFKWIYLETYVSTLENSALISNSGIKIFFDWKNQVLAILKIVEFFNKEKINNVFSKSLIN